MQFVVYSLVWSDLQEKTAMALANTEIVHEGWLVKSPPTKRIWRAVSHKLIAFYQPFNKTLDHFLIQFACPILIVDQLAEKVVSTWGQLATSLVGHDESFQFQAPL